MIFVINEQGSIVVCVLNISIVTEMLIKEIYLYNMRIKNELFDLYIQRELQRVGYLLFDF
jgi:hypothetical protein